MALGCMGMSGMYGPSDNAESIATIHAALDAGVNLLDTGDFYGMGHNEMLIGRALESRRDGVLLSVKFGAQRGPDGAWLGYDARPVAVKTALAYSLKRLGVDHVDIYRPARLDPKVPIEETVGAIAELVEAGYVRYMGLSEVGAEIFPVLNELGIAATTYGALSRGLLSGSRPGTGVDIRNRFPRFATGNLEQNQRLVARLKEIAADKGITQVQLAIAWVLAKGNSIVPVIGSRTRAQLAESLGALDVMLTADEIAAIETAVPADSVAGTRYDARQMEVLDSER